MSNTGVGGAPCLASHFYIAICGMPHKKEFVRIELIAKPPVEPSRVGAGTSGRGQVRQVHEGEGIGAPLSSGPFGRPPVATRNPFPGMGKIKRVTGLVHEGKEQLAFSGFIRRRVVFAERAFW